MVSIDKIERGVVQYVQNEILPSMAETSLEKLAVGMALGRLIKVGRRQVEAMMEQETVKELGYFDENKNVDLDALRDECKANMSDKGLVIEKPIIDKMRFMKDDVDKLYDYIMKQEG